jgi:hypothetical protein
MEQETTPLITQSIEMDTETVKSVEFTQTEKENFFKSVMVDKPYEETITLFDGKFKVRFRSMTVKENGDVVNQIVSDRKNDIAQDNDSYFITISTYRLAIGLVSINDEPYSSITSDNFISADSKDTYISARAKPMQLWPSAKLAFFLDAFKRFEAKVIKLTDEVANPNFWKASA